MLRVVLVESDPSLAWLYREEFEEAGFQVSVLPSLAAAQAALRTRPAHLVVADRDGLAGFSPRSLGRLRALHQGPLLVLDSSRHASGLPANATLLRKSSDLGPLLRFLRRQALPFLWNQALGGRA